MQDPPQATSSSCSKLSALLQATNFEEDSTAHTDSSEGLLNLLLLADSSLQDCIGDVSNDMPDQQEAAAEQGSDDATHTGGDDSSAQSMSLQTAENQPSTSNASKQHPISAGTLTANAQPATVTM